MPAMTDLGKTPSPRKFREISGNITAALLEMMYAVATGRQSLSISIAFLSLSWRERRPWSGSKIETFPWKCRRLFAEPG
jgi:hypothetical protein